MLLSRLVSFWLFFSSSFSTNGCASICSFISNSYNSFSSFCTFVFLHILIQYFCCCCFMLCCMSAMSYQSIEPIEFQRTYRYGPAREKQLSRIYECISHQLQIQNKSKRNKKKKHVDKWTKIEKKTALLYPKTFYPFRSFDQQNDAVSINIHTYHAYREANCTYIISEYCRQWLFGTKWKICTIYTKKGNVNLMNGNLDLRLSFPALTASDIFRS